MTYSREGKDVMHFTCEGSAYLGDNNKELGAVNKFVDELKGNAAFSKAFPDVHIDSAGQGQSGDVLLTNFVISCRSH
jgi:hypothetical protein